MVLVKRAQGKTEERPNLLVNHLSLGAGVGVDHGARQGGGAWPSLEQRAQRLHHAQTIELLQAPFDTMLPARVRCFQCQYLVQVSNPSTYYYVL